jgi:hypothetical protein
MTSGSRPRLKPSIETIDFAFSDILLDKVPFCYKTFSLRFRYRITKILTDPTPVENFCVRWSKRIQFQRSLTRDISGSLLPSVVDVRVFTHAVSGKAQRNQIGSAKIDLAQLATGGSGPVAIPIQSSILETSLQFNVAVTAGDAPVGPLTGTEPAELPDIPVIRVFARHSWFSFKNNPDLIDQEALALAEASTKR